MWWQQSSGSEALESSVSNILRSTEKDFSSSCQTLQGQERMSYHPLSHAWEECGSSLWLTVNSLIVNTLTYANDL
jgi:hypothetical protein